MPRFWRTKLSRETKSVLATWILILVVCEWLVYPISVWKCTRGEYYDNGASSRMVIIADPQLTDSYSYGLHSGILLSLVQFYSDIYMKRSFHHLMQQLKPEVVLFLGDLFDGGREHSLDSSYQKEMARFMRVFPQTEGTTFRYLAGNHDIGFGDGVKGAAVKRFRDTFGPLSYNFTFGEHDIFIVDVISLSSGNIGTSREVLDYLEEIASHPRSKPRVLFSHVPLYRPYGSSCGSAFRLPAPISMGKGYQYQNIITRRLSERLLEIIQPSIVFSGDDHHQCEYYHRVDGVFVPEYTVGTFSWLQGNSYPSFGIFTSVSNSHSGEYSVCFLPRQIVIYLFYLLAALSTAVYVYYVIQSKMGNPIDLDTDEEANKYGLRSAQRKLFIRKYISTLLVILIYGLLAYFVLLIKDWIW